MKPFQVYQHPIHGFEAVKVGFSWPAFAFGIFWMLAKKLWRIFALWIALYIAAEMVLSAPLAVAEGAANWLLGGVSFAVYLALWLVPAFKGNAWLENQLLRRGFQLVRRTNSHTVDAAIAEAITHGAG
jgi:hypothetical protein